MMDEYKPNSNKYKQEQKAAPEDKKIEKVVSGVVKTKKKSELRKLSDVFISEDAPNVKSYILMDVLVPAIKNAIEDVVINGIRMILRGETGARKSSGINASRVNYTKYSDSRDNDNRYSSSRVRSGYQYDDIIIPSRGEAEEVLSRMDEIIDNYGMVSVGDLYDLVGVPGQYTDNKYGWTNIRNARAERVREGYLLKLPKPLPLN